MKGKVDPKATFEQIDSILNDFRTKSIDPDLTKEDISSIKEKLDKVQLLALKMKLKPEILKCYQTNPLITSRDLVVRLLQTLPKETPPELIAAITNHILEEWSKLSKKMAA